MTREPVFRQLDRLASYEPETFETRDPPARKPTVRWNNLSAEGRRRRKPLVEPEDDTEELEN